MRKTFCSKFVFLVILTFNSLAIYAQSDSTILTYKEYLDNIIQFHPIAKKADLKLKLAKVGMLEAKGNLDPVLAADWKEKQFDDKLYYRQYQTKLNVPTTLGIEVVAAYENTAGVFLNPENKTDDFGLWYLGLEANVLQGLWINERKIAIEQAKIYQALAKNEQQIILNDLIYNASASYLIWQKYVFFEDVLNENVSLANTYFDNTKQAFFNGEKTAMDTLEAFILYQDALVLKQKNELGLMKSRQTVENYLWYDEMPIALQKTVKPESYKNQLLQGSDTFETPVLAKHPIILASINKLSYLEIEQRLKQEKLKPKLKIKYHPLVASSENSIAPTFSANDYKWGFDFSMPLLLRTERAAIQKGNIKIEETKLDIQNKSNELLNKIEASWQQQFMLREQLVLLNGNVENYSRLLEGEREKFNYGESSVFLLNKRQEKYINGQLKLIATYIKQQIELLNFLYFSASIMQ